MEPEREAAGSGERKEKERDRELLLTAAFPQIHGRGKLERIWRTLYSLPLTGGTGNAAAKSQLLHTPGGGSEGVKEGGDPEKQPEAMLSRETGRMHLIIRVILVPKWTF